MAKIVLPKIRDAQLTVNWKRYVWMFESEISGVPLRSGRYTTGTQDEHTTKAISWDDGLVFEIYRKRK